jgi:glycosyltransferase involved in cell wall biosynthesis
MPGKLKVLIITERFYPEEFIINDLAAEWAAGDFQVDVLTQAPSYPFGKVFKGYSHKLFQSETWKGIRIRRIFTVTGYRDSLFFKLLNYLSFAVTGSVAALLLGRKYDRVFVYQTGPLTQAIPAVLLRKLFGIPLVIWVQDVWPDMVYAYGFKKTRLMRLFLDALVGFIYRNCDRIAVSCAGFAKSIEPYVPGKAMPHFPNWPTVMPGAEVPAFKLSDKFNFTFAGNVGKFQNLENVMRGFGLASAQNPDIQLNIVGDGSDLRRLKDIAARDNIKGVVFWGRKKQEEMPAYFNASDVMIVSLCSQPVLELTVPAKFQAYLAFSKPVFAVMGGEVAGVVKASNTGFAVPPDDLAAIAAGFRRFYELRGKGLADFSAKSKQLLDSVYDRTKIVKGIGALLRS